MATPRGTKLRAFTESGEGPDEVRSRARSHKPPAKAISARKAAGLKVGGNKIPPKVRERLDKEELPKRTHPTTSANGNTGPTRYGKRDPKAARHDDAAESREPRRERRP